jgi:ribokinase
MTVVVVGSANLDLIASLDAIPAPGETVLAGDVEQRAGGKGLNQAVAAARADATTTFVAAVGDDDAAEVLLGAARDSGVDPALVRSESGASGTAWIMVGRDGENAIVVTSAANATLSSLTEAERDAVVDATVVVAQLETPLTAVTEAAVATTGTFVLNAAPARDLPDDLLSQVDVLVVNEGEAAALNGVDALLQRVGAVVVTLGAKGALVADDHGRREVAGVRADVVDTTGAGDTFTGYLAAALAAGSSLDDAVARAVVAGAIAVERPGAVPSIPTAEEVDARS